MGARNRTGAGSGPGGDVGADGSAVVSAGNKTGAGSAPGGDAGDDGSVVVDDGLAAGDDGSAVGDDGSAADDDGSAADNDGSAANDDESAVGIGKRMDTTTGDIRTDLIKDFNNGVPLVVSTELSCIVPDKHAMDSPARILAEVINNPFEDISPLSMALSFSPLPPPLPASGNSGNIPTTFIYYMLICMQDLVPS